MIEDLNAISPRQARYYEIDKVPPPSIEWIKFMCRVDFGIPFLAPRSVPIIGYVVERGETIMIVITDKGQERYVTECSHMIKPNDIIAGAKVNYFKMTPRKDPLGNVIGINFSQVTSIDPRGSIPKWITTWTVRFLAEPILLITDYLKKKKKKNQK